MGKWQYPNSRRVAMQVTMWAIFLSSLGLAAFVAREQKLARIVKLTSPVSIGGINLKLPANWEATAGKSASQRSPVLAARESAGRGGRVIAVYRQDVSELVSPEEFLYRNVLTGNDQIAVRLPGESEKDPGPWPIKVGGFPGLMVRKIEVENSSGRPTIGKVTFIACAVLPSRQGVTIRMESTDDSDYGDDRELVSKIAETVNVDGQPALTNPKQMELAGGAIKIDLPSEFSLVDEKDAYRTSRVLIFNDPENWLTVELSPCVLLGDNFEREAAILPIIAQHGVNWYTAKVLAEEQSGKWRIVHASEADDAFPPRGFVLADARGNAMLAIFHGGFGVNKKFDALWEKLSSGVHFESGADYASLVNAGASEVARVSAAGVEKTIVEAPKEQWWLWRDASNKTIGWSHVEYVDGPNLRSHVESRWRPPTNEAYRLQQQWVTSNDLRSYQLHANWSEAEAAGERGGATLIEQQSVLSRGEVLTELALHRATVSKASAAAGKNFLPGGVATILLGRFLRQPMMVGCESLFAFGGSPTDRPILTTITPAGDHELTVELNGSGEAQRWSFDAKGLLQAIEMSDGIHGEVVAADKISAAFDGDARLRP